MNRMTTATHPLPQRFLPHLLARQAELRATLQAAASDAVGAADRPVEVGDFKDVALHDAQATLGDATVTQALAELEQVAGALRRIELGSYGTCERCGEAIDERRLAALPAARYCTDCQAIVELARPGRS